MPKAIEELGRRFIHNPVKVEVAPQATTVERVDQYGTFVNAAEKQALLTLRLKALRADGSLDRALVFTRTKHGADRVVRHLAGAGIKAAAIHGNKSQNNRLRALENFRSGKTPVLIASDIAARGIDIDEISHVINYDLPNIPETYVHRIGRTARAGASGHAVSFCDAEEREYLRDIEKLTKVRIPVKEDQPAYPAHAEPVEQGREGRRGPHAVGAHPQHRAPAGGAPRSKPATGGRPSRQDSRHTGGAGAPRASQGSGQRSGGQGHGTGGRRRRR
jgi:ATP-dependent RNA helicase RhlE